MRGGVRRLLLDTAPLRLDRDYRWLWSGQVISGMGNQITRLALPYQVYTLTGSTLAIAALTIFQLVPILLFALGGGALADAVDRRKMLLVTQVGLAACSLGLLLFDPARRPAHSSPCSRSRSWRPACSPWSSPPAPRRSRGSSRRSGSRRRSPSTSSTSRRPRSSARRSPGSSSRRSGSSARTRSTSSRFLATFVALLSIKPIPPLAAAVRPGLAAIREGLRFVRGRPPILGSYVHRPHRDDLRDAHGPLPGAGARRLPWSVRSG